MKIKKGDTVLIIKGKDRGARGRVLKAFPKKEKVLVEGINLRKKHVRPKRAEEKGEVIELPLPVPVANVKLVCSRCRRAAKIGYKMEKGKKYRVCKKCGEAI